MRFSERYGYVNPVTVLKRGSLDVEGVNGLCTCFDYLEKWLNDFDIIRQANHNETYTHLENTIWCFFMNRREKDFWHFHSHEVAATSFLLSDYNEWYEKLDLIEYTIKCLRHNYNHNSNYQGIINDFITLINNTFNRLNYAYRIVDDLVVEITNNEEIKEIEEALNTGSPVRIHLSAALKHLSIRPKPDYRNSIKESISAVESICREITGENQLGDALKKLEQTGVSIPKMLKVSFEKLYAYTNDKTTGIRHALIEDTETPGFEEGKFMIVACSAFVNYIQSKRSR